ncbi:MAG TPA: Kdo hydroxylase family protein [Chlamydiales bacterium]|nr:Kdo hydroxylase family protein [Chlamydiales bacterium]
MAKKIIVDKAEEDPYFLAKELEKGNILFFPTIPFPFPQNEIHFLLQQKQTQAKRRKNIAYKPQIDQITNHESDEENAKILKEILRRYSERVKGFLDLALTPYARHWKIDYTSFRPFQEKGRDLRLRARNDLLHIDAFPTRPLHGHRIFRFFTNINPEMSRNWITSDPFAALAEKYGGHGVPFPKSVDYSFFAKIRRKTQLFLRASGIKSNFRSPYDIFMLQLHNFLKESTDFQKNCKKDYWDFPSNSCWAVFTDQVSHAALSGQYALEQTFLIPVSAMLFPDKSPLRVLERLSGRNLLDSELEEKCFLR